MQELEQINRIWTDAQANGESSVLATVVRVHGSTYRRPGARLLLTTGGRRAGSVSGGCLEADLAKKAWWLTEGNRCVVRRYDTTSDGEVAEEFGLGCNGVIHVLLERPDSAAITPFSVIRPVRETRSTAIMATVIASSDEACLAIGQRWLQHGDGKVETTIPDRGLTDRMLREVALVRTEEAPRVATLDYDAKSVDIFIEPLLPPVRLLVFGAGADVVPMVRLSNFIGYETIVLDGRSDLARRERFPGADQVVVNSDKDPVAGIAIDRRTACLVMSHSYAQDLSTLRAVMGKGAAYLGILGPRRRTERMLSEAGVRSRGHQPVMELHSPMGLDIGSDGAEQIALAVIAEIQATLNRRAGGKLRDKAGPLHLGDADAQNEEAHFVPASCPLDF